MADSNSKKPMALLLLVVVAVLVVIMVGQGDSFAGHGELKDQTACEGAKGTWGKVKTEAALEGWDGTEATCTGDNTAFTAAKVDDAATADVDESADANCMETTEAA